jgi:tetratricopeptide (TPR) repeat protein
LIEEDVSLGGLLIDGRFAQVCEFCERQSLEELISAPDRSNWAMALMNLGLYEQALALYQKLVMEEPDISSYYAKMGSCHWHLGNCEDALLSWEEAARCKYQPLGGGVEIAGLLLYVGCKLNQPRTIKKATTKIQKFWKTKSTAWPSPLAGYLLEDADWSLVERAAKANPRLEARYLCQALFWKGFVLGKLSRQESLRAFAESADIGGSSVLETERYLAKWELLQI